MKQIPLSQGKFALVDDEDFEELNKHKWYAKKSRGVFYASRTSKIKDNDESKTIHMHRVILGFTDLKIKCDHIDHNGLNNQKTNLRASTHVQNCNNRRSRKNSSSEYKGVSWSKFSNKWHSQIQTLGKKIHIGYFFDEIEAAKAYDEKAKELFGEFAYLNFK
jgi:hypothetical protein